MDADPFDAPRPPPRGLVLVLLGLVVVLFFSVGALTQLLSPPFGLWFSELFVFLGVAWVGLRWSGRSPVAFTGLAWPGARVALTGFAVGLANFFLLVAPLQWAAQRVLPAGWRESFDQARVFADLGPVELALVVSAVTLAAPFCEEFFFRGVLQRGLGGVGLSPWPAIALTAGFFAAFHVNPLVFFGLVEVGLVFGWLAWRTGSIWPAVFAHSANNLVSATAFLTMDAEGPAQAAPGFAQILPLVALGAALALVLAALVGRFPGLLPLRPHAGDSERAEPTSAWAAAAPWVAAALLALAGLGVVDARGVRLRWHELQAPLDAPRPGASDALKARHSELKALRARVRRGEASFEEWARAREALGARRAGVAPPPGTEPVAPVPVPEAR